MANSAYQVGRGRPPLSTRFKPGQSGNPSGSPKNSPSFRSELMAELGEPVSSTNKGADQQAARVDPHARGACPGRQFARDERCCFPPAILAESHDPDEELSESDVDILKHLEERERQGLDQPSGAEQPE